MATQNQSIRKNLVKAKIGKSQRDSLCRVLMVVVGVHRRSSREGKIVWEKIVHWKLARKCNFESGDEWYEHERGKYFRE